MTSPAATFRRRLRALALLAEAGLFHFCAIVAARRPERYLGAAPAGKSVRGRALPGEMVIAVWRASRLWPGRSVCLQRALVLNWMLRRRGYASRLHYGIAPVSRGFSAHAWTSLDERILIGGEGHDKFREIQPEAAI